MMIPSTNRFSVRRDALADLSWAIHITYYAFVFSLPFLIFELGFAGSSIPRTLGYLFMMTTVLKPSICYKRLDKAILFFVGYLVIFVWIGLVTILSLPEPDSSNLLSALIGVSQTLVQVIVLFWVSSNLLTDSRVARASLSTFVAGCILLGIIQFLGFTGGVESSEGRVAAFGTNPNLVGGYLALGLVTLVGLAYGQANMNRRARACLWLFSTVLLIGVLRTGSRGAVLDLLAGCGVFLLHRASLSQRVKLWALVVLAASALVIGLFTVDTMRVRWERTLSDGDTSGRDGINAAARDMIAERPLFGWGPVVNRNELGRRFRGTDLIDAHNTYFHLLTEVGVLGSIPFFLGVFFCLRSAWKARKTSQGILPLAILTSLLAAGTSATIVTERVVWLFFAYAAASATYPIVDRKALSFETIKLRRAHPGISQPILSSPSRYQRRSV